MTQLTEKETEELMRDYAVVFGSPAGQRVLADLSLFTHLIDPLADDVKPDRVFFKNEGRREVGLRITKFTNTTMKDLVDLRLGRRTVLRNTEGEVING